MEFSRLCARQPFQFHKKAQIAMNSSQFLDFLTISLNQIFAMVTCSCLNLWRNTERILQGRVEDMSYWDPFLFVCYGKYVYAPCPEGRVNTIGFEANFFLRFWAQSRLTFSDKDSVDNSSWWTLDHHIPEQKFNGGVHKFGSTREKLSILGADPTAQDVNMLLYKRQQPSNAAWLWAKRMAGLDLTWEGEVLAEEHHLYHLQSHHSHLDFVVHFPERFTLKACFLYCNSFLSTPHSRSSSILEFAALIFFPRYSALFFCGKLLKTVGR